jgi:hypothetical protein
MNRRFKNRLIDLAFNDLSQEESAKLEAKASKSPKAAKELRDWRVLSESLKELNPPEHQLSNDRLRAAILGQGLKPKPVVQKSWDWSLIGMCAGSFSVAAVAVVLMHSRKVGPAQVVGGGTPVASMSLPSIPSMQDALSATVAAEGQVIYKPFSETVSKAAGSYRVTATLADRHTTRRGHRKPVIQNVEEDPSNLFVEMPPSEEGDMRTAALTTQASSSKNATGLKPVDGQSASNVVVIDPERDEDTGARKAREVAGGTNVPVSG